MLPFGKVAPMATLLVVVERWLSPDLATAVMLSLGWGVLALIAYGTIAVDRPTRAWALSFLRSGPAAADPATAHPTADGPSANSVPVSALPKELT